MTGTIASTRKNSSTVERSRPRFGPGGGAGAGTGLSASPRTSGRGTVAGQATAQAGLLDGGRVVGHVQSPDVGARSHDGVDPVEDLVGQRGLGAREEVVEVLHGARADDRG